MSEYIGYLKISVGLALHKDFDRWLERLTYPWARKQDIKGLGVQIRPDGTEKYVIAFRDSGRMEADTYAHGIALRLLDLVEGEDKFKGEGTFIYGVEGEYDPLNKNTNMIYRFDNYGKAKVNYSFPMDGRVRYHKIEEGRGRDEPFTEITPPTDFYQGKGPSLIQTRPY